MQPSEMPERIWLDRDFQPWRVWTIEIPDLPKYVSASGNDIKTARAEAVREFVAGLMTDYNVNRFMAQRICCDGRDCGCMGADVASYLEWISQLTPFAPLSPSPDLASLALSRGDALAKAEAENARLSEELKWAERSSEMADHAAQGFKAEVARLREALTYIDALDPEGSVEGFSRYALAGLVRRMGEIARTALGGDDA